MPMANRRPSADDLAFAATWIEAYDGDDDDENNDRRDRVAAWLRAMLDKDAEDAAVRRVAREFEARHGRLPTAGERARIRALLRESQGEGSDRA